MPVLRFLLCLLIFAGAFAAAGVLVLVLVLVLSTLLVLLFPPLLLAVVLACGVLGRLLRWLSPGSINPT